MSSDDYDDEEFDDEEEEEWEYVEEVERESFRDRVAIKDILKLVALFIAFVGGIGAGYGIKSYKANQ